MQAFGLDTGLKLSADLILHLHPGSLNQVDARLVAAASAERPSSLVFVAAWLDELRGVCQSLWFEQLRFACDKLCTKIG